MSTIGREALDRIASALLARDIETIDAPVTGGPPVARAGNLTIMVSGKATARTDIEPILAAIGRNVHVMGERAGMAQTMKMVNNLIMATNMIAACEGLAMGVKAGLAPETMMRVLEVGTAQSFAGCEILSRAVQGTFDYGATLSIVDKDVTLGLREATALQIAMPVIRQACGIWNAAGWAGHGDEDFTAIMKVVERRNSVIVRSGARCLK
jgi:3-hydroxyisobutyrate dehydrogenase